MKAENDIDTPMRTGEIIAAPVAADTIIYGGTIVALNATGHAVPADPAVSGAKVLGRAEHQSDNRNGADGGKVITVRRKAAFLLANSTDNPVTQADIGGEVFVEDDGTVANTGDLAAGKALSFEDGGVWVYIE